MRFSLNDLEFEYLRHFLLHLQVDVLIIEFSHLEEARLIAVGTYDRVAIDGFHGVFVETTYMTDIELQLGAILASESRVALESISELTLESPLSRCCLGSIGIKCRQ